MALTDKGRYIPIPVAAEIIHVDPEGLSGLDKLSHTAPAKLGAASTPSSSQTGAGGATSSSSSTSSSQSYENSNAGSNKRSPSTNDGNRPSPSKPSSKNGSGETIHNWAETAEPVGKWTNNALDIRDDVKWSINAINALSEQAGLVDKICRLVPGLAGVVKSSRWKMAIAVAKASFGAELGEDAPTGVASYGKYLDDSLLVAGLAANLAEQSKRIDTVIHSQDSNLMKAAAISSIVSTAAQRTAMGAFAGEPKFMYSIAQALYISGSLATGHSFKQSLHAPPVQFLQQSKHYVDAGFNWMTDADNQIWLIHHVRCCSANQILNGAARGCRFARNLALEKFTRPRGR